MDDKQTGLKESMHGKRDEAGVTEHPVRAGRKSGYSTPSPTAGECGHGVSTGDEGDAGHTHPASGRSHGGM